MTEPDNGVPWKWQLGVAVVLLLVFVGLAVGMLVLADTTDAIWKNRVYVFGSVEAIVFAAVGWLFGREVNRSQVESAREEANEARQKVDEKSDEAAAANERAAVTEERGRGFVDAVELAATTTPGPQATGQRGGDIGLNRNFGPDPQLAALHELGRRLFPERMS